MEQYTLPEGIILNGFVEIVPGVPNGALVTVPGVARTCLRCGHEECPCCDGWCDSCLGASDDNARREGDWIVNVYGNKETRYHVECARDMSCSYDREQHQLIHALFEARDHVFANIGGSFGVTEDGRVWMHGETEDQVRERNEQKTKTALKLRRDTARDRDVQIGSWESYFKGLTHHERSAYIAGMHHARTLMEWLTNDFEKQRGLRTSVKVGNEMIANVHADIEHMEKIK